jgi:predicted PolB exonuclease-like 3'-5' exonuclease
MRITPTLQRRNVFLDIETVALDPDDDKGALSAASGRIVCICLMIDDGQTIAEEAMIDQDENLIIRRFWDLVYAGDVFIGHNAFGFDLPFVRQRSWILGIRPSRRVDLRRFYTNDVIDTMETWSNWGATKFIGLDKLGGVLAVGGKTAQGSNVASWWANSDLRRIADYCRDDVRLTYRIFCKLMFQELPERYLAAVNLIPGPTADNWVSSPEMGKLIMFPGPNERQSRNQK